MFLGSLSIFGPAEENPWHGGPPSSKSISDGNSETGAWQVTIPFESDADRIDFFSNHRKTLEFEDYTFPTYLSTRYTRVER